MLEDIMNELHGKASGEINRIEQLLSDENTL